MPNLPHSCKILKFVLWNHNVTVCTYCFIMPYMVYVPFFFSCSSDRSIYLSCHLLLYLCLLLSTSYPKV